MYVVINTWTGKVVEVSALSESELSNADLLIIDIKSSQFYRDNQWQPFYRVDYENPFIVIHNDMSAEKTVELPDSACAIVDTGNRKHLDSDNVWRPLDITHRYYAVHPSGTIKKVSGVNEGIVIDMHTQSVYKSGELVL